MAYDHPCARQYERALSRLRAAAVMRLIDGLDDLDDVQNVHTNADVADEAMAGLAD